MAAGVNGITRWLRLAPVFDLARLRADLDTALAWHWRAHYNDGAHRGGWTSIALRSASGAAADIDARDDAALRASPAPAAAALAERLELLLKG